MINFFKNWCEGIIVAVVISIIIESILPEGNNKKYVKVVVGIYIIFTILNPFLGKIDTEIDFENILNLPKTQETASVNTENIQKLYTNGIEETLKANIEEEFGYKVTSLTIQYDEKYENINNITIGINQNGVMKVQEVQIGNQVQSEENSSEYEDVKEYIQKNYELDKSQIIIKAQ